MVAFAFHADHLRGAIAVIGTHGLTDLDSKRFVAPYAICLGAPVPSEVLTPLFCAASIAHFSEDSSFAGSVLLHLAVLVIGLCCGQQVAFEAMCTYLACVHVPAHYVRCVARRRGRGVVLALCATAMAILQCNQLECTPLVLEDWMQRIVIAHVVTEGWAGISK